MKIEFCIWQTELNVVYVYTELKIEKGESTMKKWNSIYDCRNWIGIGWIYSLWWICVCIDLRTQLNNEAIATEVKLVYRYSGKNGY